MKEEIEKILEEQIKGMEELFYEEKQISLKFKWVLISIFVLALYQVGYVGAILTHSAALTPASFMFGCAGDSATTALEMLNVIGKLGGFKYLFASRIS